MFVRELDKGMGEAVFRRTYARPNERWADVAKRVAEGNCALVPETLRSDERQRLEEAIASGGVLMSGRHLQHGDADQPSKPIELMTNCSTAAASFLKFYLLMNGSGVGRAYDDAICLTDWRRAPNLRLGLAADHPDFEAVTRMLQTVTDASGDDVRRDLVGASATVARVEYKTKGRRSFLKDDVGFKHEDVSDVYVRLSDTREGWAEALEVYEAMAFDDVQKTLWLDFSSVRETGSPIGGMQDRPASGPVSPMRAFARVAKKMSGLEAPAEPWEQALAVDHFFSEEVQVGGARRAARMATKYWKDPGVFAFIRIKNTGGYWTANHSVTVDREFWESVDAGGPGAAVLEAVTSEAYATGEPGLINHDKLDQATDREALTPEQFFQTHNYRMTFGERLIRCTLEAAKKAPVKYITNPCVTGDTWVETREGPRQVKDLVGVTFDAATPDGYRTSTPGGFWSNGVKPVFRVWTDEVSTIKATSNHKFLTADGAWTAVVELRPGAKLKAVSGDVVVYGVEPAGEEEVFDCSIPGPNCYWANGLLSHNCGEISLSTTGGYCVIADVAPAACARKTFEDLAALRQRAAVPPPAPVPGAFGVDDEIRDVFEEWDDRFIDACGLAARALVRVNRMKAFYQGEVDRTQRIGVSLTGIHEYAWLRFGLTFDALLDERGDAFWAMVARASRALKTEANRYADELGVARPVTVTTIKPSGTVSKLFGLTEGAHLPAYAFGIRWVQYQDNDPRLEDLKGQGYPHKKYDQNPSVTLIGFPTVPLISKLGMPYVISATEATPEQQYEYLRRLEKHWLGEEQANQVSYTLKVSTATCTPERFHDVVKTQQRTIKCCAIMPTRPDEELEKVYGYLPEESCSLDRLESVVRGIAPGAVEDIDIETLRCASGACPL